MQLIINAMYRTRTTCCLAARPGPGALIPTKIKGDQVSYVVWDKVNLGSGRRSIESVLSWIDREVTEMDPY